MEQTLEFPDLLRAIDDRSAAFRAAVASAPSLDVTVPTCPEWTLFDLVKHLGEGRRAWAATVVAGPQATAKVIPQGEPAAPRESEALAEWSAESTRQLLDALREAGPDRACWAWWGRSQSPLTCAAVARRQLAEIAVHTYDAQLTVGAPEPLPDAIAVDAAEEFLTTFCTTTVAWPHEPAVVDYHVGEGRSWRNQLSGDGARVFRLAGPGQAADATAEGSAHELVLALYGRLPLDSLKLDGNRLLFDQLVEWDPER
ncbi:maleylpyruvate isomerase family mycothiol-dependent enzyme [Actinoplanes sp. NPDC051470]|uniref:maleylpyruvate isomerase family mycothiol-dependent enzyme n=1 Tax=unclassified Actinoplanes TaxID=2626549 RepID=UPI00341FC3A4